MRFTPHPRCALHRSRGIQHTAPGALHRDGKPVGRGGALPAQAQILCRLGEGVKSVLLQPAQNALVLACIGGPCQGLPAVLSVFGPHKAPQIQVFFLFCDNREPGFLPCVQHVRLFQLAHRQHFPAIAQNADLLHDAFPQMLHGLHFAAGRCKGEHKQRQHAQRQNAQPLQRGPLPGDRHPDAQQTT